MNNIPNARIVKETDSGQEVTYESNVGGALKVRYVVERGKGFVTFSPANLHVELNGQPIEFLQELNIEINSSSHPKASLTFKLTELDIDMDSLLALKAIVEDRQNKKGD